MTIKIKDCISVKDAIKKGSGEISLRGWVHRERGSNKFRFIVLRDSTEVIQCIASKEEIGEELFETIKKLQVEASVLIHGIIRKEERAPTGFEVDIKDLMVVGESDTFPITKDQSPEFLADKRHLWLRSRKMTAMMKIRSTVFTTIRNYFLGKGFYEYHSPTFQGMAGEGGSTLFEVKYFDKKVFLAQTWQLYAEPAIMALEKIFTISPSFRAEKSVTSRHLTEYWHAEMEVAWEDFEDIQNYGEELIQTIFKTVIEKHQEELKILERDVEKIRPVAEKPFKRMTYDEALIELKEKHGMEVEWGKDLRTLEEDTLTSAYDVPIIVTHYPKIVKAFYMKEAPENPKVVLGYDLLAPEGYGEIIGASEREVDIKKLEEELIAEGEDPKDYEFYLDTRRWGSVPHGGFGLGVERVISWICGLDTIKDAIPFPRTPVRFTP